jgi:hypothetical protein
LLLFFLLLTSSTCYYIMLCFVFMIVIFLHLIMNWNYSNDLCLICVWCRFGTSRFSWCKLVPSPPPPFSLLVLLVAHGYNMDTILTLLQHVPMQAFELLFLLRSLSKLLL